MKVARKIFVGSIILLFMTVPILASADVNNTTTISPLRSSGYNDLGTIQLQHQPILRTLGTTMGLISEYFPPGENPNYDYYFPQDEDGNVYMNFTLQIKHLKNPSYPYWVPNRFSDVTVWINFNGVDYIYNGSIKECKTIYYESYNFSFYCVTPLRTNNTKLAVRFFCTASPIPSFGLNPPRIWKQICSTLFGDKIADKTLYINPI
jgi:hypothetical protein